MVGAVRRDKALQVTCLAAQSSASLSQCTPLHTAKQWLARWRPARGETVRGCSPDPAADRSHSYPNDRARDCQQTHHVASMLNHRTRCARGLDAGRRGGDGRTSRGPFQLTWQMQLTL